MDIPLLVTLDLGPHWPCALLSTTHAASSYGQPVLVLGGQPYGPADIMPDPPARTAAAAVHDALRELPHLTREFRHWLGPWAPPRSAVA